MKKLRTRLLSLLLVMAMVVTLLPVYSMAVIAADSAEEVQEPQEEPKVEEPQEEPQEEPKVEEPQEEPKVEEPQEEESKEVETKETPKKEDENIDLSVGYFDDRFSSEWVSFDTYTQGQKKTFNGSTYRFSGWYTGIDGSGSRLRKEADAQIDGEYYAKWVSEDGVTVTTTPLDFTKAEVRAQYSRMKNGIRISGNDTRGYKVTLEGAVIDCRVAEKTKQEPGPTEEPEEQKDVPTEEPEEQIDVPTEEPEEKREVETTDAAQFVISDDLLDELNLAGIMGEGEVSIQDITEDSFDEELADMSSNPDSVALLLPDNTELSIKRSASSTIIVDVEYGIICVGSLDICGDGKLNVYTNIESDIMSTSVLIMAREISNSANVKVGSVSDVSAFCPVCACDFENYGKFEVVGPDLSYINIGLEIVNSITNYGYLKVDSGQLGYLYSCGILVGEKFDNYGTIDVNTGAAGFESFGMVLGIDITGIFEFSSEQEITRENAVLYNKGRINVQSGDVPYGYSSKTGTIGIFAPDKLIYNEGTINTTGGDLRSAEALEDEVGIASDYDILYGYDLFSVGMLSGYLYNTGKVSAIAGDYDFDGEVSVKSAEDETVAGIEADPTELLYDVVMLCGLCSEYVENTGSIDAAGGNFPQITVGIKAFDDLNMYTFGIFSSEVWNYGKLSATGGTSIIISFGIASADTETPVAAVEDLEVESFDAFVSSLKSIKLPTVSCGMLVFKNNVGPKSQSDSEEVIAQGIIPDLEPGKISFPYGLVYNEGNMSVSGDYLGLATQNYAGINGDLKASGNYSAINYPGMNDGGFEFLQMFDEPEYIFVDSELTASANADGTNASSNGVLTVDISEQIGLNGFELLAGFDGTYITPPNYFSATVREHKVTSASRIEGTNKEGGRVRGANKRATYAEGVKVTAEDKKGYDFVGWYIGYSSSSNGTEVPSEMIKSENNLYTDKTITYYPLEDTVLTAVYKPKAVTSVKLKIKAPGYTITGTDGKQQGSNSYKFTPGTSVTVKFTDDSFEFKCWRDQNGRKVSTNSEYTFTINKNTELTAEYSKKPQKKTNKWTPVRYR